MVISLFCPFHFLLRDNNFASTWENICLESNVLLSRDNFGMLYMPSYSILRNIINQNRVFRHKHGRVIKSNYQFSTYVVKDAWIHCCIDF